MSNDDTRDPSANGRETPFWMRKTLSEMSRDEWESLCDGCGKCCLVKLEDIDTGLLLKTNLACRLLDTDTCRCTNYEDRKSHVPDCIALTPDHIRDLPWIPLTCAYRKIANGEPLEWWHPLVSGDRNTVHQAGISAAGLVVSEDDVDEDCLEDHVVGDDDRLA